MEQPIPVNLLKYALYHDVAETVTGDCPYTAKRLLGKSFGKLEKKAEKFLGLDKVIPELSEEEMKYFVVADMFELLNYSTEQVKQGNRNFLDIYFNGYAYIYKVVNSGEYSKVLSDMLFSLRENFLKESNLDEGTFCNQIRRVEDNINNNKFLV